MAYNSPFHVLIRCGLAFPLLIFQLMVLPTFIYFREYRLKTCFRLMFSLGICHSIQLFIHFIVPLSRLVAENGLGEFIERLFGGVINVAWDLIFLLDLLLAIERLIIVARATIFYSTSDQEPMAERIIFNALMALSWFIFLAISIMFITPCCGYFLYPSNYSFHYDFEKPWVEQIRNVEYFYYLRIQPITFLCYVAIILLLIKEKISRHGNIQNGINQTLLSKREMRILFQSGVIFLFSIIPTITTYTNPTDIDALEFYLIILWIFINGVNPIFYLTLNGDIRQNFLKMIRILRQKVLQYKYNQANTSNGIVRVAPASGQNVLR